MKCIFSEFSKESKGERCLSYFFVLFVLNDYFKEHLTSLKPSLGTLDPGLKMRRALCFCYCKCFNQLYSAIAVLAACPGRKVTEKSQLFHTNRRSGRDRGSNPGHLRGRQCR
jgi:hypothetical protein